MKTEGLPLSSNVVDRRRSVVARVVDQLLGRPKYRPKPEGVYIKTDEDFGIGPRGRRYDPTYYQAYDQIRMLNSPPKNQIDEWLQRMAVRNQVKDIYKSQNLRQNPMLDPTSMELQTLPLIPVMNTHEWWKK